MHINTAVRWVIYAGSDWADYLATRAAEQSLSESDGGHTQAGERR
jgi:hypothetical protein